MRSMALVRQKAVCDVPLGEEHRLAEDAVGDLHAVELLILGREAPEDLHRVLDGGSFTVTGWNRRSRAVSFSMICGTR